MPLFYQALGQGKRRADAIRLIIHGGALKGCDAPRSSPVPYPERGPIPGAVIEIAADDLDQIEAAHLARIDRAWLHNHDKLVRRLPDLIWQLPGLSSFTLTDSSLNQQLFKRGLPESLSELRITGSGRFVPKGPVNPHLRLLDALMREFHPRFSPEMFPALEGLQVHVGRKADKKDRSEMLGMFGSFANLRFLGIQPADQTLPWTEVPSGLVRLEVGNGDLADLGALERFSKLEYLSLRFLKQMPSLHGIERLSSLRQVSLVGMVRTKDLSALLKLPNLKHVHGPKSLAPEAFGALEERGVVVQG